MLTGAFGPYMEMGNHFGNRPPTPAFQASPSKRLERDPPPPPGTDGTPHREPQHSAQGDGPQPREAAGSPNPSPAGCPHASWTLRDELAQAWEDVYGEPMDGKKAWLEVRFGIRRALFILLPDGKYVKMVKHGDQSRPPEGVA